MTPSIRRIGCRVMRQVVETVYPRTCAGCGMRGMWLCDYCETTVPPVPLPISCLRCGVPSIASGCICDRLDPLIMRARSALVYDGWAANAVKQMKYHSEPARAEHLAAMMTPLLEEFGPVDGLVPVPLHASREKQRGYNQSALLALHISTATNIPVLTVLHRTRKTVSQTSLSGEERTQNVAGVFAMDASWVPRPGGRYVLIDDVRTTGATLNACVEALRPARPESVGLLTFALDLHRNRVAELKRYRAEESPTLSRRPPSVAPQLAPTRQLPARHQDRSPLPRRDVQERPR